MFRAVEPICLAELSRGALVNKLLLVVGNCGPFRPVPSSHLRVVEVIFVLLPPSGIFSLGVSCVIPVEILHGATVLAPVSIGFPIVCWFDGVHLILLTSVHRSSRGVVSLGVSRIIPVEILHVAAVLAPVSIGSHIVSWFDGIHSILLTSNHRSVKVASIASRSPIVIKVLHSFTFFARGVVVNTHHSF